MLNRKTAACACEDMHTDPGPSTGIFPPVLGPPVTGTLAFFNAARPARGALMVGEGIEKNVIL